jgi:hypothetical protein
VIHYREIVGPLYIHAVTSSCCVYPSKIGNIAYKKSFINSWLPLAIAVHTLWYLIIYITFVCFISVQKNTLKIRRPTNLFELISSSARITYPARGLM